jgi:predicted nucleic acid-binding protein
LGVYFVDTSALAKRYTNEVGSKWVRSWITPSAENSIIISELTIVEMFTLFARREHNGDISPSSVHRLRRIFLAHVRENYFVVPLTSDVLYLSRVLVSHYMAYRLRTLDAIQLACAVEVRKVLEQDLIFVAADDRLRNVAYADSFKVDDPRLHH